MDFSRIRCTSTIITTDKDLHILKPTASVHKTVEIDIAGPWGGESYHVHHSCSLSGKQWVELTCSKRGAFEKEFPASSV